MKKMKCEFLDQLMEGFFFSGLKKNGKKFKENRYIYIISCKG